MGLMRKPSLNIPEELREAILPSYTVYLLSVLLACLNASERASVQQLAPLVHKSAVFQEWIVFQYKSQLARNQ